MKPQKKLLFVIAILIYCGAQSQCIVPFEVGNWTNMDGGTRGITRMNINFSCNDVVLCGIDANGNVNCPPPAPPFSVHLWGKCSPSDCDWNTVPGNHYYTSDGATWIYSYYDQGFAKRWVYIKKSSLYPGKLYLYMRTHFTDGSGRSDYILRNWFNRS